VLHGPHKTLVRQLAGILRIADNLDRGHRHLIERLEVGIRGSQILVKVFAEEKTDIEIQAALENADLFEQVFERRLLIEQD
jgi:exopolyphosphatase/guanosine-5'-triphosphate,3'-diphosphate pyrophosphatase